MYNSIVVGGFAVTYRHRDPCDRIKVDSVHKINRPSTGVVDLPARFDDCSGQEFFQLLEALNKVDGDVERANLAMVRFD